jgi:hypothetical protein
MSFLFEVKISFLGSVMLNLLGVKECMKLDSACCNKQYRKILVHDIFTSNWFKLPLVSFSQGGCYSKNISWIIRRQIKVTNYVFDYALSLIFETLLLEADRFQYIPNGFCETESLTIQHGMYPDSGEAPIDQSLIFLVNSCDKLTQFSFHQDFSQVYYFETFFQYVKPEIMNHLITLKITRGRGGSGSVSRDTIKCLELHCLMLQNLSLSCSGCLGSEFYCLLTRNRSTLQRVILTHCANIDDSFFEFIGSTFGCEQLIELSLKHCMHALRHVDDDYGPRKTGMFWTFNPFSKLVGHVKSLQFVSLSFREPRYFHKDGNRSDIGYTYDGRNSANRRLFMFGLGELSYNMFTFCDNIHKLTLHSMCDLSTDVVNRLVVSSPNLRSISLAWCDQSFTRDQLVQLTRMKTVEQISICHCRSSLSAEDIQDILCQENMSDNLKIIYVSGQGDFKFVHLLRIATHNHKLHEFRVENCHPTLLGSFHEDISVIKNILKKLKNKTLKFGTTCHLLEKFE